MEINIEKHKILNEYLINGFWLKMVDDEIDLKTLINTFNLNTGIKINSLTLEEAKKEIVNIIERLKNEPKYYLQKKKSIILGELPTHARGDGMGFGFHRVCVITNV